MGCIREPFHCGTGDSDREMCRFWAGPSLPDVLVLMRVRQAGIRHRGAGNACLPLAVVVGHFRKTAVVVKGGPTRIRGSATRRDVTARCVRPGQRNAPGVRLSEGFRSQVLRL